MTQPHHFLINLPAPDLAAEADYFTQLKFTEINPPLVDNTRLFSESYLHLQLCGEGSSWRQGIVFITEQPLDSLAAELQLTGLQTIVQDDKIRLVAPDGTAVYFLSQPAFSFPGAPVKERSLCGAFYEISLEVEDLQANELFWKTLGFQKLHPAGDVSTWLTMSNQLLKVGLYRKGSCLHPFHSPAITWFNAAAAERLQQVQEAGISVAHTVSAPEEAILESPAGHHLFMFKAW